MRAPIVPPGRISEAFYVLAEFAVAAGARHIALLQAPFEARIDDAWWMAANGADVPRLASNGAEVPGRCIYVERHGWPAGFISMHGGFLLAATENDLIAACKAAQARLKAGSS